MGHFIVLGINNFDCSQDDRYQEWSEKHENPRKPEKYQRERDQYLRDHLQQYGKEKDLGGHHERNLLLLTVESHDQP